MVDDGWQLVEMKYSGGRMKVTAISTAPTSCWYFVLKVN